MKAYEKWDREMVELHDKLQKPPINQSLMKLQDISFADWVRKTGGLPNKAATCQLSPHTNWSALTVICNFWFPN